MRKLFFYNLKIVLALALALFVPSSLAYAEEDVLLQAGESSTLSVQDTQPLSLSIDYIKPVTCNTPTIFTMKASGGAGEYKYRPYSLHIKNGSSWEQIVDFSYKPYTENNTFEYTFTLSGDYELRLSVFDKIPGTDQYQYTTARTYFTIQSEDAPTLAQRKELANTKADAIWAQCKAAGCKTDYEKALWLHDWVIDNCTYDNTLTHYQAADVLLDGTGTCEGYHAAYMTLLQKAGISCGRVQDSGHVWTSVKMDGQWYHVDTTNDDVDGNYFGLGTDERHLHFGMPDNVIKAKLAANNMAIAREDPVITAASYDGNYFFKSGRITEYSNPFNAQINEMLKKSQTKFSIEVPRKNLPPTYKEIIYNLVAQHLSSQQWTLNGKNTQLKVSYSQDALHFSTGDSSNPSRPTTPTNPTNPTTPSNPSQGAAKKAMYRLYNPISKEHFYTADAHERDVLSRGDWQYEGIGWYAPTQGNNVYRLYHPGVGEHHYTSSLNEKNTLVKWGWRYEGVGWKTADASNGVKLYRLYNPGLKTGSHHYTKDKFENDYLVTVGWRAEGIGWYDVG